MTGDAIFVLSEVADTLYVPTNFIKSDVQGKYVLVNEGKDKVYVTAGVEGEEYVEISGDLNEGQMVYD